MTLVPCGGKIYSFIRMYTKHAYNNASSDGTTLTVIIVITLFFITLYTI